MAFPLDSFTANLAVACDYRRLLTSYAGALIRVKRTTPDTTESDIGATADGSLDEAALLSFTGAGSGYVVKRYDQSGGARDLIGAGTNGGPRIVNAGVIERLNGRPCGRVVTTDDQWEITAAFTPYTGINLAAVCVARLATIVANDRLMSLTFDAATDHDSVGRAALMMLNGTSLFTYRNSAVIAFAATFVTGLTQGAFVRFDGTNGIIGTGAGSVSGASASNWNFNRISTGYAGTAERLSADSYVATMVLWLADPGSSNVETVRAEAATYWAEKKSLVYPPINPAVMNMLMR